MGGSAQCGAHSQDLTRLGDAQDGDLAIAGRDRQLNPPALDNKNVLWVLAFGEETASTRVTHFHRDLVESLQSFAMQVQKRLFALFGVAATRVVLISREMNGTHRFASP